MKIGVGEEVVPGETRVALTPDSAKKYLSLGCELVIESGAGLASGYTDAMYTEAGVNVGSVQDVLQCDAVLCVQKPGAERIAALRAKTLLVGFLAPHEQDGTLEKLADAGVSAMAVERIPRISRSQSMDALSSQANIAGYRAVVEAASHYSRFFPMMMTAAGSARPAKVVILGAGVAGLQAIATARRLGAEVESFDVRPEVKEQIESLGAKFIELELGESGSGEGGYAKALSEDAQQRQRDALAERLGKANVVVTTALIPGRPAPVLVTEQAIKNMRAGSVVVDMAAAAGGNCPLTQADRVIEVDDVKIVGHTNYPAMVGGDASAFYARNLQNLLMLIIDPENPSAFKDFADDEITQAALVCHEQQVLNSK